ncbi:uncharacterized protein LOC120144726 [Hibiscus syriacus]|uniref:uncharacterized protein LOC120144726 n=1 Tax=Hibiscus syriacus TaxID=106335 RepID=UPI001921F583|nr:uncharacterized protein LOC120144726 [Hibiscus syriacus]
MFYNGVNAPSRMMLDASGNDIFLDKSPKEAFDILDRITNNDYQFLPTRIGTGRKISKAYELDGSLPGDTEVTKPHGKEQCSALTLRSGTQINIDDKFGERSEKFLAKALYMKNQKATPPFPQRLKKHNDDIHLKKFVDVLDKLYINVPLLEAIDQMPPYTKFLKDIVTNKRKVEILENVTTTTKYCLALSKLPPKQKYPGSFVKPSSISDNHVGRALCDLGSYVNLMPKSIFLKLQMSNAQPTNVILQLTDRSHVHPEGEIEDMIVKEDKFIFLVDFLILDCETNENAPIILGLPFLITGHLLIDCEKGEFTIRVTDQSVTINVFNTLKYIDDFE